MTPMPEKLWVEFDNPDYYQGIHVSDQSWPGTTEYRRADLPAEDGWRGIESRPTDDGALSYFVFRPKTKGYDDFDTIIQVSNFEGRMYPDARQCVIDYEDGIEGATHWKPLDAPARTKGE